MAGNPAITADKLQRLSAAMKKHLAEGPPELRQAYMRIFLDKVEVDHGQVRISGSRNILSRAASEGPDISGSTVITFAREWRPVLNKDGHINHYICSHSCRRHRCRTSRLSARDTRPIS